MDYATPQPREYSPRSWYSFTGIASLGCVLALIPPLVLPRLLVIFREFKMDLPLITKFVIKTPWPIWSGGILTLVAASLSVQLTVHNPSARKLIQRLTFFALLAFAVLTILACFMPVVQLIDAVGGDKTKK